VEKLVKAAVPKATVVINEERPRKGSFSIVVKGEVLVNLESMPRPFTKLKSLDMESLADQIIEKLNGGGAKAKKATTTKKSAPAAASKKRKPAGKKTSTKKVASKALTTTTRKSSRKKRKT